MSVPAKSLNASVNHKRLLDVLGCTVRTQGLPLKTRCPVCETGVLTVMPDRVCGGAWHWCRRCESTGDLIELAAAVWKLTVPESIVQLTTRGVELPVNETSIQQYVTQHVEYRERLRGLWNKAKSDRLFQSSTVLRVADRLGLGLERVRNGFDGFIREMVGALNKSDVDAAFQPGVTEAARARNQNYNPSQHRIFSGEKWGDVLTVPFYDLPNRIACFLFAGRNGDPAKDIVLKRANRGPHGNQFHAKPFEAGLAFPPGLFDEAERRDRKIVAVHDPFLAIRLQSRHSNESLKPLPIVSWLDSAMFPDWKCGKRRTRTRHAWQMLNGYEVVFWMPHFNLQTMRQAILVDGKIAPVGPDKNDAQSMKQYLWRFTSAELFRHLCEHARPWQDVLSAEMAKRNDARIEQLLVQLEHEGEDVDRIVSSCRRDVRERVAEIRAANEQPRSIDLDGHEIVEKDREWWAIRRHGRQELVSNAVLRLDAVAMNRRVGAAYARGRILYGNHEVRFVEKLDAIDKNPLRWMHDLLLDREVGVLVSNSCWRQRMLCIAQAFHKPEMGQPVDTVGWDAAGERFVLPDFSIKRGGNVEPIDWPMFTDDVPARNIEVPETLSPAELDQIRDLGELSDVFWATVACVTSNILAPACNEEPRGICLTGHGAAHFGVAVAKAMGCRCIQINRAADVAKALELERAHAWPVISDVGPSLQDRHLRQLLEPRDRNCIIAMTEIHANVAALQGNWNVISSDPRRQWDHDCSKVAGALISDYLRDVCKRYLGLVDRLNEEEPFVLRVLRDLADYVTRRHADPGPVLAADSVLMPDRLGGHAEPFADLLQMMIQRRSLKVADKADGRGKPTLVQLDAQRAYYLSHEAFEKLLRKSPLQGPDHWHLETALCVGEAIVELDREGYLIDADWLEKQWRRKMVVGSGMIKVHV